jgi:hypothetical protein
VSSVHDEMHIGPQPSISIYNFGALGRKGRMRLWSSAGAIIESRCGCLLSPCCEPYPTSKEFLDSGEGPSASGCGRAAMDRLRSSALVSQSKLFASFD